MFKRRLETYDRFIPTRALINFDLAYSKLTENHFEHEPQYDSFEMCRAHKKAELKRRLDIIVGIRQRIFNLSHYSHNELKTYKVNHLWPCQPRKKPILREEKILDLPEFNYGYCTNPIDWGSNDLIATSVSNQVVIGGGGFSRSKESEIVADYESDKALAVHWSSDGHHLGIGLKSGMVQIWNVVKQDLIAEEICCIDRNHCKVTAIRWHRTKNLIVWGCSEGKISCRSFNSGINIDIKNAHKGRICKLKYSPNTEYLCSSGTDSYVRVWKGVNFEPYLEIEMSNPVRAVAWHPWKSGFLAIGEGPPAPGSISFWNVNIGHMLLIKRFKHPAFIDDIQFSKITGELVLSQRICNTNDRGGIQSDILVLDKPDSVVDSIIGIPGSITSLLWSPDGRRLGTAGSKEILKVWTFSELRNRSQKRSFNKLGDDIVTLAYKKFKCTIR